MPRTRKLGFWGDINKLAEDALHTAVAPVEGPINQGYKDINDFGTTVKDIWDTIGKAFGDKNAADVGSDGVLDTWTGRTRNGKRFRPETPPASTDSSSSSSSNTTGGDTTMDVDWVFPPGQAGSNAHNDANNAIQAITQNMTGGADGEVPIAKVPRAISKIHPDHFNIRLPYIAQFTLANSACQYSNVTPVCLIRLNSIYDCLKSVHNAPVYPVHFDNVTTSAGFAGIGSDDPTANKLANPIATAVSQAQNPTKNLDQGPQGRNIWQAHFKYYRVLRSDVKITFLNKNCDQVGQSYTGTEEASTVSSSPNAVNVFRNSYAIGFELVDEDAQVSNNAQMFLMTKNAERNILGGADLTDISFSTGANAFCVPKKPNIAVMQYTYNPDTWQYHVELANNIETRWTPVGQDPTLNHLMAIRMFHMDSTGATGGGDQNYPTYTALGVMIQIEYEVQFMECLDSFYKTQYFQASVAG